MILQKSGYSTRQIFSNLALGVFDGIDSALWCYAFATIIFSQLLSQFLPLGLVIMLGGWALLSIFILLTSKAPVHMVNIDEQAVVIIGSIAVQMMASQGEAAASPRGLTTILAIMSLVSVCVSISFFLSARFQVTRLLELLPYPVICGFMAGIGWLLLDAGVTVALDEPISLNLWIELYTNSHFTQLSVCLIAGLFLFFITKRIEKAWALPVASTAIVVMFYFASSLVEMDMASLRADDWVFDLQSGDQSIGALLGSLSFNHIDVAFIVSVFPQILTVVFLTMLNASMNLSAMTALNIREKMNSSDEIYAMSGGNLACGLIACPPGFTDAPASILYRGFGATTRWMPLASSCVCLAIAFGGNWLISYTPRVLIAGTIFLFAFQLFYDWMYANVKSFSHLDYAIVCIILVTVISLGFMQGILIGIVLTVLIFVLRYSRINAIQNQYTISEQRSSVERSAESNLALNQYGVETLVFTLRGFLFFGTANIIRDNIRMCIEKSTYRSVLIDLHQVTGIDISAMNSFSQLRQICDLHEIELYYVCRNPDTRRKLIQLDAVGSSGDGANIFSDTDTALENLEESLLDRHSNQTSNGGIKAFLEHLVDGPEQVQALLVCLERMSLQSGEYLFRQGDLDNGLYIIESGSMSALIELPDQSSKRLKKFIPGAVVGELSRYTDDKTRTASVVANNATVVYHLNPAKFGDNVIVHALVARTASIRIDYMNRRLLREMT